MPIPRNEKKRLRELHACQILDTPPEGVFDELTRLAAAICETPMALVSLVAAERQWFKARVGVSLRQTPREHAFCAHAIMRRGLFEVPDTREDPRFARSPLVQGGPRIRFYAGIPLLSPEGHALGTLCVMDRVARRLTLRQRRCLTLLGRQVMALILGQRRVRELERALAKARRALP